MGEICRAWLASSVARPLTAAIGFLAIGFAATPMSPAQAADLPVPGPAYYPKSFPPPAIYDWTGIYIGGNVGGGILTDSVSQNGFSGTTNLVSSGNLRPAGVVGGGQIGANWNLLPGWSVSKACGTHPESKGIL